MRASLNFGLIKLARTLFAETGAGCEARFEFIPVHSSSSIAVDHNGRRFPPARRPAPPRNAVEVAVKHEPGHLVHRVVLSNVDHILAHDLFNGRGARFLVHLLDALGGNPFAKQLWCVKPREGYVFVLRQVVGHTKEPT